jgi:hypothetical protein
MKIGIVAQYLDSRNDIRKVIELLAKENEVFLYVRKGAPNIPMPGVTIREIHSKKSTFKNHLLLRLFILFGNIPRSTNNFYITEAFKIANTKTSAFFKFEKKSLLLLSKYLPNAFSYDQYLNALDYTSDTEVEDIDKFLFFSEIYDDFLLAHLLMLKKKVFVYVYSWDHPCKIMRFSKRVHSYFVWNEGLKEDMIKLQGIPAQQIHVLGSSQLAYIKEFQESNQNYSRPFTFDYIYFGCATGTKALVEQEVQIVKQLANVLARELPKVKLVVRPYPFLAAWQLYQPLQTIPNIVFDNEYRKSSQDFTLSQEKIYDKFIKISHAKAFVHLGTTMGFEATYFNTPVLQINYTISDNSTGLNISDFIHQYQNDKYLILKQYPNVIQSPDNWPSTLALLHEQPEQFLLYNQYISRQTKLYTFEALCEKIQKLISFI